MIGNCHSEIQGFTGKVLDDWAVSGITQFQSGFPIRLNTEDDNELINSLFFLGTEAPSLVAPFQKLNPGKHLQIIRRASPEPDLV